MNYYSSSSLQSFLIVVLI